MLTDIKMIKNETELGHSDRLKIYVNPSKIYVDPGILQSILKLNMQHDKAAGLQTDKIQADRESEMVPVDKNS